MPYVARDNVGQITAVSDRPTDIAYDSVPPNDPELQAFMSDAGNDHAREKLSASDLEMVRIIEDLVDVLIGKTYSISQTYRESRKRNCSTGDSFGAIFPS